MPYSDNHQANLSECRLIVDLIYGHHPPQRFRSYSECHIARRLLNSIVSIGAWQATNCSTVLFGMKA